MSPVRRRVNPAKVAEKTRPYWWFQGASVAELLARLTAAGPDARFEVHLAADQKMTLVVIPPGATAETKAALAPPINESFVCPPRCT